MTVFKTFWKVVQKYKGTIILYTVMLIFFGGINMATSNNTMNFESSKPDVLIINNDSGALADNLVNYFKEYSNIKDIKLESDAINDALFYRDVNYIIYIPEYYTNDILKGNNPQLDIKSTGDYMASLAEVMLTRYLKVQDVYKTIAKDEGELTRLINDNLSENTEIVMTSRIDTNKTSNASLYFSFASYSIMAVIIFIVCLVISSFKEESISKRTIISSMNYKKHNKYLLLSSFVYAILVWILFVVLGMIILKDVMFTSRGLVYMLNSFVFTFCSLTIALLISTIINNKEAVSGIVNVIALGSAFLCGAFVPAEFLPSSVLKVAHILPAYWYINSNDLLKTMEVINLQNLKPIFINCGVILIFSLVFIALNNVISKYKQKVG